MMTPSTYYRTLLSNVARNWAQSLPDIGNATTAFHRQSLPDFNVSGQSAVGKDKTPLHHAAGFCLARPMYAFVMRFYAAFIRCTNEACASMGLPDNLPRLQIPSKSRRAPFLRA